MPVHTDLKYSPSAHLEHDELQLRTSAVCRRPRMLHTDGHVNNLLKNCTYHVQCPKFRDVWEQRISERVQLWDHNCPPKPVPEKPARPEQQGHRPPDRSTATAASLGSSEQTGPWGTAAQQGCRRPSTNCNYGATTVFAPSNGHVHNLVQELQELQVSELSRPWYLSLQTRATNNHIQELYDNARILHYPDHGTCR